jgi:hypothetical protein
MHKHTTKEACPAWQTPIKLRATSARTEAPLTWGTELNSGDFASPQRADRSKLTLALPSFSCASKPPQKIRETSHFCRVCRDCCCVDCGGVCLSVVTSGSLGPSTLCGPCDCALEGVRISRSCTAINHPGSCGPSSSFRFICELFWPAV